MTLEERYYKELHGSYFNINVEDEDRFLLHTFPDFYFNGLSDGKVKLKWVILDNESTNEDDDDFIASDVYILKNVFKNFDKGTWILCDQKKRDNTIDGLIDIE